MIDGDTDAPLGLVAARRITIAGVDQGFDIRSVEVATHHPHTFAVGPVESSVRLIQMKLLGRIGVALRHNLLAVLAVEIGPLDRAVVQVRHAHVGPVDMAAFGIDCDAIRISASGRDDRFVFAIRVHRQDVAAAEIEDE
ncbi:MAG: hypothetical protein WDM89_06355 [Rhizomicrobium sp.]